jgi:hypothetical protein
MLNPEAFASSRETIYILANEGAGSAASPPTALAVAIAMAMEKGAERHCGRLALITLAELANVVRWASLPDQFAITAPRGGLFGDPAVRVAGGGLYPPLFARRHRGG